ncbi:MAG: UDP-N-acetylmuramoyl-L-alanyl-D-glutamate--2,6-diaminopimelate ligase, partial [Ignavibacteriales bacterium]|nr:UDP-N-acetylmuramoyl-L-alanyl-D-glutamate--2,6-diaminopimelate ligase [Ignavibacteriales bacterium]
KKLKIFGVTGTNGKTTSIYLLKSILDHSGEKTGLLGTIEYKIGEEVIIATHTTPESLELNGYLERMVKAGCSSAAMEVSSHALAQHRVHGVNFACAIFTNLTQDHLDYHETMNKYFKAKKILFDSLSPSSWAVVNIDDEWGRKIYRTTAARVLTYGTNSSADVQAKNISLTLRKTKFTLVVNGKEINIESCLIGRFNVYNILAACSAGIALGIPITTLQEAISEAPAVHGRFEQIASPSGWIAIVDYAHTHDALDKVLKTIHDVFANSKQGKIIAIFGCGGNRDRGKRPKMAQVVSSLSDITIVTSDNPRNEDPNMIISEVIKGIKTGSRFYCEVDRMKAIFMALDLAAKDDIVLIAGKGHEDYQIIGNQKVHFSDKEVVEEYLRLHT